MKRAILQLLANALEAMTTRGVLKLRTAAREDFVELEVADNGKGIPAAILPHIFDTFFPTKPGSPGLGLPIVQKIISQHRGQISIESEEKVGTTVTVRLPAAKPPGEVASHPQQA
jgi:signal transduction histidine kinase